MSYDHINQFIAHVRGCDHEEQPLMDHLCNVAELTRIFASKVELPLCGHLIGLLHDFGKYSEDFQNYIRSATGLINPDAEDYIDAIGKKGTIDHSTAGAQWVWQLLSQYGPQGEMVGQFLALCLASHHGGLLDCLQPDGTNGFIKRVEKKDNDTHLQECLSTGDKELIDKLETLVSESLFKEALDKLGSVFNASQQEAGRLKMFRIGFLARFLFSCLIDADRIDSADFENPENVDLRRRRKVEWQIAIDRLEDKLSTLKVRNDIDRIRNNVSEECLKRACDEQGIYTLTIPTGGGKTFTSIRYGLYHAKKHNLDHIFYIIPYTSIIEQNARVVRDILEYDDDDSPWVLEHHSNLEPEIQTWQAKLAVENWDAPIIFTTMVQFLETLLGGGTRGPRRLHNLANSLIIFDEIQSLPINCVHLFNNGLQFLVDHAGSTALLCTATQPLLGGVNPEYGALAVSPEKELTVSTGMLFKELGRVQVIDMTKPEGWNEDEIVTFILSRFEDNETCLVVVNTKEWAQILFDRCCIKEKKGQVFHLSTNLCPAHRKEVLAEITTRLESDEPVLCISTQLIEAGVDVDFNCVIRFLAGLDSIAQAAGRCNRNGFLDSAEVYVVNPAEEKINMLTDILVGQEKTKRVLSEMGGQADLLSPKAMECYFSYYFYERSEDMQYPLKPNQVGRNDTMLNLLSDNPCNIGNKFPGQLLQSFKTAGKAFKAIDAPTRGVIVPFREGRDIIGRLCAENDPITRCELLKKAQKYSVNVFPNVWKKLVENEAVYPVQEGEDIYYLDEQFYSERFGVAIESTGFMDTQII